MEKTVWQSHYQEPLLVLKAASAAAWNEKKVQESLLEGGYFEWKDEATLGEATQKGVYA